MIELDPTNRPTMSVDEFAIAAGVGRGTAYEAVRLGQIPSIRLGRRIRIPTASVRRMLELGLVEGGPDAAA
jgi:excisionase family DNA binding protein